MASSTAATSSATLFLVFILLFFTMQQVTSTAVPYTQNPVTSTAVPYIPPNPVTSTATCPEDVLKLGVCANLLNNLVNVVLGAPSKSPCCTLIGGLADLDAAVCLCTAIKANVLGINLDVPVSLTLLLNYCGKSVPSGYQCA